MGAPSCKLVGRRGQGHGRRSLSLHSTRESHIYPKPIFRFVLGIFSTDINDGTNRYKCPLTEARRDLIQPTWYKCLTFVPVGGSALYKCEANTFVPGQDTTQYKCGHI
jgi:hypothetical protein